MKTLKQLIQENVAFEDNLLFNEEIRKIVKEWILQQETITITQNKKIFIFIDKKEIMENLQ